jgi:type IV pilus assembly protein PilC
MPIANALRLSLRATGNPAFQARSDEVVSSVRGGRDLTTTLQRTGLFPDEYEHIIAVAEESGQLSEVLRQQAEYYHEEAGRQLQVLARLASFGVWLFVAVVIIVAIFRIFGGYLSMLDRIGG